MEDLRRRLAWVAPIETASRRHFKLWSAAIGPAGTVAACLVFLATEFGYEIDFEMQLFEGALTLRPPTLSPLITPTQTLGPQNLTAQKRFDHVTLSPKSGRIVRPTKIVTLRPQKVGRSVTGEHYDPL